MEDETNGRGSRRSTVNLRVFFSCNNYLVDRRVFDVAVSVAQKICDGMIAFGDLVGNGTVSHPRPNSTDNTIILQELRRSKDILLSDLGG
jgi:hypothetical protein